MIAAAPFPHFPMHWPDDMPTMAQQILLAAKIEALTDCGAPPPIVDDMIELLDWYDGDADFEDDGCAEEVGDELDSAWVDTQTQKQRLTHMSNLIIDSYE
jgi:hypothetical protein